MGALLPEPKLKTQRKTISMTVNKRTKEEWDEAKHEFCRGFTKEGKPRTAEDFVKHVTWLYNKYKFNEDVY